MANQNLYSATMEQRRQWGDEHSVDLSQVPLLKKGDVVESIRFEYCSNGGMNRWWPLSVDAKVQNKKEYHKPDFVNQRFVVIYTRWERDFIGGQPPFFMTHIVWARLLESDGSYNEDAPIVIFEQSADPKFNYGKNKSLVNNVNIVEFMDISGRENLSQFGIKS